MLLKRKLLHYVHTYKYKAYSVLILLATLLYFLFKWNLFCSNFQAWQQADRMCKQHEKLNAVGSLCAPVCYNRGTRSFQCHTFGSTKEAVFSVELHKTRLIFKSAPTDTKSLYWFDNGVKKYPGEKEFSLSIQALIRKRFGVTPTQEVLQKLTHLQLDDGRQRHKEMENIWTLIQSNEYILSTLYSDRDLFPQMLGTCGSFFAVEYVEPLEHASALLSVSDSIENWTKRLRTSLQILELLEEFETSFKEPFHLCDIKLQHFGIARPTNRIKFIDLDSVFPNSVLMRALGTIRNCTRDEDCHVYDCKSRCLTRSKKCADYMVNSNLQIVCEKIFLGWRLSNTVMIPGLLISEHTPSALAAMLRQCAHLQREDRRPHSTTEEDLRERLINVLTEIEQSLNEDAFR